MGRLTRAAVAAVALLAAAGCRAGRPGPHSPVAGAERALDSARFLADQVAVTEARGADRSARGLPLADLRAAYQAARARLDSELTRLGQTPLAPPDSVVAKAVRTAAGHLPDPAHSAGPASRPACRTPIASAPDATAADLEAAIFACYGVATRDLIVDGDTLDRLSILGLLGTTPDRARRERLFRALEPVWLSVNGRDEPDSPYRRLVRRRLAEWTGEGPIAARPTALGIPAAEAERWLEQMLAAWSATLGPELREPWDYYYAMGEASRILSPRIPRDSLLAVNHRVYRALGADPDSLNVRYDLEPRPGKYPIAFTTFGARAVDRGDGWERTEPWVFASYRHGGFDNLNELLHETGHAVHIAAIRARPALHDWPDSDTYTEAVAELATWDMFEPAWQSAVLGAAAPLNASLRSKYAAIMMDAAWALFEFRVHRPGAPSPNEVWTDLTGRYLKIKPHPEWSWWAMRGQLIESPGYLLNYGLGAVIAADLRQALVRRYGPSVPARTSWYREVSQSLFRFGLERPAAEVLREVLGRAPAPEALIADLARIRAP